MNMKTQARFKGHIYSCLTNVFEDIRIFPIRMLITMFIHESVKNQVFDTHACCSKHVVKENQRRTM